MKFALVNGVKKTAESAEVGICICCNNPVRAYCGSDRVNHWKHINAIECDTWSEGETEWHRLWKNKFDVNQQEIIQYDPESGEKHIADVYLKSIDLVLEFQHSPIHIDEIKARESFYKKMIWIVDLQPYKENISFHRDIGDSFRKTVSAFWETRYRKSNELEKEGRRKEAEALLNDEEVEAYFRKLESEYFRDYFEKKSSSATANNLLNILEKEREKAKRLNQPLLGYSLSEEYKNQLQESQNKHLEHPYLFMIWKHKHKRWNNAELPLFFDIGDNYIYHSIENIQYGNGFIVRKYSKERFISKYNGR